MRLVTRYPLMTFLAGNAAALVLGVLVMASTYRPPQEDIVLLIVFMSGTASLSLLSAYLLYRLRLFRRVRSLVWTLTISVIYTVLVMLANIWIVARLMFINAHDFALMTALLVFGGLTAVTFGFFIAHSLADALRELAEANQKLASGDLSTRLDVRGNDEIAELAVTFNLMANRLQQVDEQKRQLDQTRRDFVAWVSHDLRTPLTAMRVLVEAILDGVASDAATQRAYLRSTHKEIEHLNGLIDDLFELAQIDSNEPNLKRVLTTLQHLVREVADGHSALAAQRGIRLNVDTAADLPSVLIDPEKIQRVLHNLIDNALRYTPAGGEIDIRLSERNDVVQVEVFNTGAEISQADLPYIFDRFYRAERSRARDTGQRRNVGLGLTVARGLVEAHGGKIWAESNPNGTTFRFILPAAVRSAPTNVA